MQLVSLYFIQYSLKAIYINFQCSYLHKWLETLQNLPVQLTFHTAIRQTPTSQLFFHKVDKVRSVTEKGSK